MRYSREYLEGLSERTGFAPDTLEKVLRLERLLDQVTRHPFLGPRLALKGGTALNLFYGRAPRLSVDLDFNYVGAIERAVMLEERPTVERALATLVEGDGYRLQWGRDEHAGRKTYLGYVNGLGTPDRIEVDLNYMFRVSLGEPTVREGWMPDPDFPCRARIVGTEEILAGKTLALLDRTVARDLFDVATVAAEPPPHDPALFRPIFVALSGILPRPLSEYSVQHLEAFSRAGVEVELGPVLHRNARPTIDDLRRRVAPWLAERLALSAPEREYVERLQWGEFKPELLAADQPALLSHLLAHPALLWKVENARRRP